MRVRERYFIAVSVAYLALGVVVVVRAVTASALPAAAFGIILLVLGAVRLRDYLTWRRAQR